MPDKRCIYCQYAIPRALKSDALMLLMIWGMPWDWSVPTRNTNKEYEYFKQASQQVAASC